MRYSGGWLIALGALLGLATSIYNYLSPVSLLAPDSGIAGTPGALLVVGSTAILLVFGLFLARHVKSVPLAVFLCVSSLLAILGTGFAAYLLNSTMLLVLMLVCLVGWLVRVLAPRGARPSRSWQS